MPPYFIADAGCLQPSNNIQYGQQVNKLGGSTCCFQEDIKKGQPTKPHMFKVCYIPIAGLPSVRVSRSKDMNRETNAQHMPHAITCLDMPLGPITWCQIV